MKRFSIILIVTLIFMTFTLPLYAQEKLLGEGMVIYCQMGGAEGAVATIQRTLGAREAAKALGVKLIEQYSQWQPEKMVQQFKEAIAAQPDGIVIMGHPGSAAMWDLVREADSKGIIVTVNNTPLPDIQEEFLAKGFGYAGVDLFAGGYLTGQAMVKAGLKPGDKAIVYGLFSQPFRGQSEEGMARALEDAGIIVDRQEISPEADADASTAIPILTGYFQAHPDCKAIGTQHGAITGILVNLLRDNLKKKPGEIISAGIDLSPATIEGLKTGYISAVLDQQLYLQGFIPIVQIVLTKKYKITGFNINTGAGTVTPETIGELEELITAGYR
ncbi:MAG: substrate-binding domain-containing protein [Candidatus Atribacteria bacterium]|nr:substrate-binding domain-containing protein [Candidatus Atribacteria bacterium]